MLVDIITTIKKIILVIAIALPIASFAESPKSWNELINRVITQGEIQDTEFGEFRILTRSTSADLTKPHLIRYLSAIGGSKNHDRSNFNLNHVELVWEDWQIDSENKWNINQWLFKVSSSGTPLQIWHYNLVIIAENGHVLKHESILETTESKNEAWQEKLSEWVVNKDDLLRNK